MQMQALLSFTSGQDFNVALLDDVVRAFASPSHPQQQEAGQVLVALQNSPTAWTCVDGILEQSKEPQARYIGLQILEATIQFRWKSLPQVQRDGIKTYIVGKVIKQSQDAESLKQGKTFLNKLNLCLVNLLKQEWPQNWPTFIDEMVDSAKSSELICENNLRILKLLSEEVFDFSEDQMVSEKIRSLKDSLNSEFGKIFQLCAFVMQRSQSPTLLPVCLGTLLRFIKWIPIGYIYETAFDFNLLDQLVGRFLQVPIFRNDVLSILTEVADMQEANYKRVLCKMYVTTVQKLTAGMLPLGTNIAAEYATAPDSEKSFVQKLALFLTTIFSRNLGVLEAEPQCKETLIAGMQYLAKISEVDDDVVFKICLEYWHILCESLYSSTTKLGGREMLQLGAGMVSFSGGAGGGMGMGMGMGMGGG